MKSVKCPFYLSSSAFNHHTHALDNIERRCDYPSLIAGTKILGEEGEGKLILQVKCMVQLPYC